MDSPFTYDGSLDQYSIVRDARYPMFSDYAISDYSLSVYPNKTPAPQQAKSFENKYQEEQQGIPSYYPCNCKLCPIHRYPQHDPKPMRIMTVDERTAIMEKSPKCPSRFSKNVAQSKQGGSYEPDIIITPIGSVSPMILFVVFIFIMFVFICCFYGKALGELKSQLNVLKDFLKK